MRLPVLPGRPVLPRFSRAVEYCLACSIALGALCVGGLPGVAPQAMAQAMPSPMTARERLHQSDQWAEIQKHLPDPATASAAELETQGDILRARRFPEDAMDYYRYAIVRGGNMASLTNKLGLSELELRNIQLAMVCFQRVVKMNRKGAEGWNNLGAAEFLEGSTNSAVSDYKKAIKLDKKNAVYHANIATAYFSTKDFGAARREMAAALADDPQVFERREGTGGVSAHVLSSQDRARFSFEMAKLYARSGMQDQMLHSLAMAYECGMDVQREMEKDPLLAPFEMDPRVVALVHDEQIVRNRRDATVTAFQDGNASPANPL